MARTSSTCAFLLIGREKLARSSIICCKVEHDRAIWGPVLGCLMAMARHHFVRRKSGLLPIPSQPQSIIDGHDLSMVPLEWESSSSFLCILRDYYNCNCNYVERRWIVTFEKWTNFKKMPTMRFASVFLNDTLKRTKQPFETPNNATERSKIVWFFPKKYKERLPYHGHISCDSGDTVQTCPSNLGSGEPGPLRDRDIGSTDSPAGNSSALLESIMF